ncbi:hybrid sensor histidine kinase/response regulator [Aquabacterium humicola]|uniref:hybrid sensor histidine kinase/response regulator n=1 Tax=Aquabacterium humicola TaxID=3237377 RepID=UPI002543A005|nr:ATP-binding protein [Rubrivivax pictus]
MRETFDGDGAGESVEARHRQALEAALSRSLAEQQRQQRLYAAILDNTPDLAYVFDLDHRFVYANAALLGMWGKTWDEAIGRNCLELGYEPWHAEMHDREIEQVVATRLPIRGEVPFHGTYGLRTYDYIFVPVIAPDGSIEAVAGTTRDVTEYRENQRRRDEFLAMLSHELRNPLAPLSQGVQLLAGREDLGARPLIEMMDRQVRHLVRLVDDLLDVSRVTRGTLELRQDRIELGQVARSALEASAGVIDARGHAVEMQLPPEPVWMNGDAVRLAQVLSNLLINAAHYTPPGGRIELTLELTGDEAAFHVRDNGDGIAAPDLAAIFEMFRRGAQAGDRAPWGLGVGLALAQRLAALHGGRIEASSPGPGRGSEFVVRLPRGAPSSAAPAGPAAPKVVSAVPGHAKPAPLDRLRVLIADDNVDAADSLAALLGLMGAVAQVVHDGPAALEASRGFAPDAVLLDIGMPHMDGYEVARRMRAEAPDGPLLIALTGWGQAQDREQALAAGFDLHLVKPVDVDALCAALRALRPAG